MNLVKDVAEISTKKLNTFILNFQLLFHNMLDTILFRWFYILYFACEFILDCIWIVWLTIEIRNPIRILDIQFNLTKNIAICFDQYSNTLYSLDILYK